MTTDKHRITPEMQADLDAVDAALAGTSAQDELTELGRLALELRAERPEPDPFFTRELDARAAAGFPRRRPASGWRKVFSPTLLPGAVASVLIVVVIGAAVIGDTAQDDRLGDSSAGSGGLAAESAPESDTALEESPSGGGGGEAGAVPNASRPPAKKRSVAPAAAQDEAAVGALGTAPAPPGGGSAGSDARERRVEEKSASLTLSAPPQRIAALAADVRVTARRAGGFVLSSSVSTTDGDGGGGIFELRVPTAKLQFTLDELAKLAHVSQSQTASQDITRASVSARDRLEDARAERVALLRRLARADGTKEIDRLKRRLRIVSARIQAAKADIARVNNRASFSNVAVSLVADPSAGEPGTGDGQWSPGDAARDALRVLEVLAGVLLIALAIGLPLALLVALVVVAARLTARRRRERALDAI